VRGTVRVLLFAAAREAVGRGVMEVPVAPDGLSAAELLAPLAREHPAFARVLATSRLVHNGEFVSGRRFTCRPGDEVAVHPPYSGG
jgi:molybdopterin converting factor small subunit